MEGIQISVATVGSKRDVDVVKITGYIDTTTSSELERVIQGLLREQRYKIIINLGNVDYISSAGWGIFISEIKNIRTHHGDLKLANMSETVAEVYELLEFSTILTSAASVAEAVSTFSDHSIPKPAAATPLPAAARPASRPAAKPAPPAALAPLSAAASPAPAASADAVRPMSPPVAKPATTPAPAAPGPQPRPASVSASSGLLPLINRVRAVVQAHPNWGAWKIKKGLNQRRGDQSKVSWGEVRAELKYNDLGSKAARFKFARGK